MSRFNIFTFSPTPQEWLLWARKAGVDHRVTDFIQEDSIWLDKTPDARDGADTGLDKTPDRRAWKRVSDIIKDCANLTPAHTKAISGMVGAKSASAFLASVSAHKILSGRDILYNFEKSRKALEEYQLHELSVVNDGIYRSLEIEKVADKDKEKVSKNLEAYFDFLAKSKKEAAAHFATQYVSKTYPEAVKFIARECRVLTMSLVIYVKSIKI